MVRTELHATITTHAVDCKKGRRVDEIRQSRRHIFIAIVISSLM
jgi:hypothetical protein